MNNISKKLEVAANIAILVVALLLGVVLVKRYLAPSPPPGPERAERLKPGDKLALAGVDWGRNKRTLVMVLSTNCHFCTESAPFYQRLAREKSGREDVGLLAVLPQSVEESRKYLDANGVAVGDVRQEKSGAVRVPGTPTLILVDSSGAVVDSWVGKLPPEKEEEVVKSLLPERAGD